MIGGDLVCNTPCGFGIAEGRYAFSAVVSGFVPTPVSIEARYDDFDGGCPSTNSGSTRITVVLLPAHPG